MNTDTETERKFKAQPSQDSLNDLINKINSKAQKTTIKTKNAITKKSKSKSASSNVDDHKTEIVVGERRLTVLANQGGDKPNLLQFLRVRKKGENSVLNIRVAGWNHYSNNFNRKTTRSR